MLVMSKIWFLRLHRWLTLLFSIPLAVIIVTGLILSFEPIAIGTAKAPVTADAMAAILAKHDPGGKARSLVVRAYAGTVSISGPQRGETVHVDLATNEKAASPGTLPNLFTTARQFHERLLFDWDWLVTVSTFAMLVLFTLGVLMGWPRLRNTMAGWHKGTGWILLPLLALSPVTGLFLAFSVTFSLPLPRPAASLAPVNLAQAAAIVSEKFDLSQVTWIRPLGEALAARINDNGEMRVFAVTRAGLLPANRNWPRLLHEGNWSTYLAPGINVVISAALVLLFGTGIWMWSRRKLRPRLAREHSQTVGSIENTSPGARIANSASVPSR
jgi:uncharacterized iron-regulated membrane protein